jgi:hypothetical protein
MMKGYIMERDLEWEAFVGDFDGWVAQMELDRINFELQMLAEAAIEAEADVQYDAMVAEFDREFRGEAVL